MRGRALPTSKSTPQLLTPPKEVVSPTKHRSRVAAPTTATPVPSPLAPIGHARLMSTSAPLSPSSLMLTMHSSPSVDETASAALSSPQVRLWHATEARKCMAYVADTDGPVTSLRIEESWSVPPPARGEVCSSIVSRSISQ
jgi:hypothetical protein